jgi:hypothetical protein
VSSKFFLFRDSGGSFSREPVRGVSLEALAPIGRTPAFVCMRKEEPNSSCDGKQPPCIGAGKPEPTHAIVSRTAICQTGYLIFQIQPIKRTGTLRRTQTRETPGQGGNEVTL